MDTCVLGGAFPFGVSFIVREIFLLWLCFSWRWQNIIHCYGYHYLHIKTQCKNTSHNVTNPRPDLKNQLIAHECLQK